MHKDAPKALKADHGMKRKIHAQGPRARTRHGPRILLALPAPLIAAPLIKNGRNGSLVASTSAMAHGRKPGSQGRM